MDPTEMLTHAAFIFKIIGNKTEFCILEFIPGSVPNLQICLLRKFFFNFKVHYIRILGRELKIRGRIQRGHLCYLNTGTTYHAGKNYFEVM